MGIILIGAITGFIIASFISMADQNKDGFTVIIEGCIGAMLGLTISFATATFVSTSSSFVIENKQTQTLASFSNDKNDPCYFKIDAGTCIVNPINEDDEDDDSIKPQTLPINSYSIKYTDTETPTLTTYTHVYKEPWGDLLGGTPNKTQYPTIYVLRLPKTEKN